LVGLAYLVGAELAWGAFGAQVGLAFFPPAGVTMAALLLSRPRRWPSVLAVVAIVEVLVDVRHHLGPAVALGYAAANTVEPAVGAWLFRRLTGGARPGLDRRGQVGTFLIAACGVGPLAGGLIGASVKTFGENHGTWAANLGHWWAGDGTAVLAVAPTVVMLAHARLTRRRQAELAATGLATAGVAAAAVLSTSMPPAVLPLPVFVWATLRFGPVGVSTCATAFALVANYLTNSGHGYFASLGFSLATRLSLLQLTIAMLVVSMWFVAIEASERQRLMALSDTQAALAAARAEEQARLERQQRLAVALADVVTRDDVAGVFAGVVLAELDVRGSLYLLDDKGSALELVAACSAEPQGPDRGPALPLEAKAPPCAVVRTGEALWLESPDQIDDAFPGLRSVADVVPGGALAVLPVRRAGVAIGAAEFVYSEPQPFTRRQRRELEVITERVERAVDRVLLYAAEHRARNRAEELHDLIAGTALELGVDEVARAATRHLIASPGVIGAAIAVVDDNQQVTTRAVAKIPAELHPRFDRFSLDDPVALTEAIRTGQPVWLHDLAEWRRRFPTGAAILAGYAAAGAALPLAVGGAVIGSLNLVFDQPQTFSNDQRAHLQTMARAVASSLARAQLFEHQAHHVTDLQQHLLPRSLPVLADVDYAVRYQPADSDLEAGGDWYDVITREDGTVVFIVGDVVGHSAQAAAIMGQLRAVSHSLAVDLPADEVLARLDRYAATIDDGMLATVAVIAIDPDRTCVDYALAGHPPPLLAHAGGHEWLSGATTPPIGVPATRIRRSQALPAGALLVLYTDGLIEHAGRTVDQGLDQLAATLSPGDDLPLLATHLIDELATPPADDVALVVLAPVPTLTRTIRADHGQASRLRADLLAWAGALDHDDGHALALITSEALANAVNHAYPDRPGGQITLTATRQSTVITLSVADQGRWDPTPSQSPGGFGLHIVRTLAHDTSISSTGDGTTLTVRLHLAPPPAAGARNNREVTLFPRDPNRLTP